MKHIFTLLTVFLLGTLVNLGTDSRPSAVAFKCVPNCSFLYNSSGTEVIVSAYDVEGKRHTTHITVSEIEPQGKLIMDSSNPKAPGLLVLKDIP